MKKILLASALLIVTAGCQPGSKSNVATQTGATPELQNQGTSPTDATDSQSAASNEIDSTSRQDAMKDLQTKVFKVAVRLQMDLAANTSTDADVALLKELFTKKGPKDKTVMAGLNSGDLQAAIELKDLQGSLTDKQMQFTAILKSFKKMAGIYGFESEKQDAIVAALQARENLITPNEGEINYITAGAENIKKKTQALIADFHQGNDDKVCGALAIFVNNFKNYLGEGSGIKLPAVITKQVEMVNEIEKSLATCKENVPAVRTALGKQLPAIIAQYDIVWGLVQLFVDPTIKDNSVLGLDMMNRWALDETKEVLEARGLPQTGEIQVDGIVCQIGGKIMGSTVKGYDSETAIGEINYQNNDETPLTVRKAKGQRGVTITYTSSKVPVVDAQTTEQVNMGQGFVATVRNMVPGDKTPLTMVLGTQEAPVFVNCRAK